MLFKAELSIKRLRKVLEEINHILNPRLLLDGNEPEVTSKFSLGFYSIKLSFLEAKSVTIKALQALKFRVYINVSKIKF